MKPITLYRPEGLKEAELILDSGCPAFPLRLPDQPFFYPVMNAEYARQIARDWNTPDAGSGHAGFVPAFDVDTDYASRLPVRTVGSSLHQELWVPAEELTTLSQHIHGPVRFTEAWYGPKYRSPTTTLGTRPGPVQPPQPARPPPPNLGSPAPHMAPPSPR